ncbi:MAG: thiamine phosphate synthase [Phycisphaerae bacterium]
MNRTAMRMLDANFNRAREALRTLEDYCRFVLNDGVLSSSCKTLRHELCVHTTSLGGNDAVLYRDTPGDVGVTIKARDELSRNTPEQIVVAAGRRLTEALRVLEELAKLESAAVAAPLESLRYQSYSIEQAILRQAAQQNKMPGVGLHVLLTESLCRHPWRETLNAILRGGADVVQLREKELNDGELLVRARIVAEECRKYGRLSIINDRTDIVLAAGASGVHLGQEDMPCEQARKLAGSQVIIGVSTENIQQAHAALRAGASYIGAGPMFPTSTKAKPQLAGPGYVRELIAGEFQLPIVAIGGISIGNLPQLIAAGVTTVAVSSAVISADDPGAVCGELRNMLLRATATEGSDAISASKRGA